jgi:hypothetical protein
LIDAEARKRGERTGLDTLVVHALNDVDSIFVRRDKCPRETDKSTTWGVRSQE